VAGSSTRGLWHAAQAIAAKTPAKRNRYVDLLRAVSICVVVFGHWLVSLPLIVDGTLQNAEILRILPWTQWLTWALQVMPVFFVVGGYSNSVSWRSATRKGLAYGDWAAARMRRLVGPLVPLLIFWVSLTLVLRQLGVEHDQMRAGSRAALIPIWFLAVYILVTALTPLTLGLYHKIGVASFWLFASMAALVDFVAFSFELPALRGVNYAFVWLAVHQLGFMWQDGRLAGLRLALMLALGGLGLLITLVVVTGYPVSMLTVPGETFSNSRPPTLALLGLGVFHFGLLLTLEAPARRWLQRPRVWTFTVLINSRIMTLYLWHLTVMMLLVALALQSSGFGLTIPPGSADWWQSRLIWIVLMFSVLLIFIALFGRFEQPARRKDLARLPTWRVVLGTVLLSMGLSLLVTGGTSDQGQIGLNLQAVIPAFIGVFLVLPDGPFRRSSH